MHCTTLCLTLYEHCTKGPAANCLHSSVHELRWTAWPSYHSEMHFIYTMNLCRDYHCTEVTISVLQFSEMLCEIWSQWVLVFVKSHCISSWGTNFHKCHSLILEISCLANWSPSCQKKPQKCDLLTTGPSRIFFGNWELVKPASFERNHFHFGHVFGGKLTLVNTEDRKLSHIAKAVHLAGPSSHPHRYVQASAYLNFSSNWTCEVWDL